MAEEPSPLGALEDGENMEILSSSDESD